MSRFILPIYTVVDNGEDSDITIGVFRSINKHATLTIKPAHNGEPFILDISQPEAFLQRLIDRKAIFLRQPIKEEPLKLFALHIFPDESAAKKALADKMLSTVGTHSDPART